MEQLRLGRLERVVLSQLWGNDPKPFTQWLRSDGNIGFIGDPLGRSLEVTAPPAGKNEVGDADVYCRDRETGEWVVVRAQFHETSDAELGQLLVLATGLTPVTLVWVANEITAQHRSVLDWLNQITADNIRFFGIELDFWRIGDSPLAPTLRVVGKPAGWTEAPAIHMTDVLTALPAADVEADAGEPAAWSAAQAPARADGAGSKRDAEPEPEPQAPKDSGEARAVLQGKPTAAPAEAGRQLPQMQEYWAQFNSTLGAKNTPLTLPRPLPQSWMHFPLGDGHQFNLVVMANARDYLVAVGLILSGPEAKTHFHLLQHSKVAIENEVGATLEWQELADKKESHIFLRRYGVDPHNRSQWPEQHDWLADKLERFRKAFGLRVEALNADDDDFDGEESGFSSMS